MSEAALDPAEATIRKPLRRAAILALLMLLAVGCNARPNFVIVYTDDQRWDTLDYMPAVQRLAEEGVVFTNSFVTSPVCGPSRASFLTGRLASTQGITLNEGASGQFDPSDTIAVKLQERGYTTGLFGKYLNGYRDQFPRVPPGWSDWRVFRDGMKDLFKPGSLYVDPMLSWDGKRRQASGYSTDLLAGYALEFIERHADEPFFLVLSFWPPHVPLNPAERHHGLMDGRAPKPPPSLGETEMGDKPPWLQARSAATDPAPHWEAAWPRYLELLLSVDEAVAAVRAKLEELELDDDTIIVFTSDNGFLFGEHWYLGKGMPYEESIRVPLIVWNPRLWHREIDELVLNIDLAPTLARLAGTRIDADGKSLLPLLVGFTAFWRDQFEIEWEDGFGLPETYRAFRSEALKYVEWKGGHRELYHLREDPHEMRGTSPTRRPDIFGKS